MSHNFKTIVPLKSGTTAIMLSKYNNLVRTGVPLVRSSFIHAILTSYSKRYRDMNDAAKENYVNVLQVLKKNILNLKYQESSMVLEKDIIENLDFMSVKKKFEIIFLDPPYKERRLTSILNNIIKFNILNNDGVIIIHRHKKERDEFPENFKIIEEKNYGISKIIFGKYSK